MKRAAISVPSNIGEGQGRQHPKEFLHFLSVANGSLAELDTQRIIAESLNFIRPEGGHLLDERITEIRRMLYSLARKLKTEN
jgi:four helix bundle protein